MAKILIIEDDDDFREGLAETARDLGHEVICARSGEEGLSLIARESESLGLAFLDLKMPGIDGLETLRRLREREEVRDLPVVVLTAFANSGNTIEAMRLGAFDHLAKPVGRAQVQAVLERALARPRPRRRLAGESAPSDGLIGASDGMREVHKLIGLAAPSDATVLISGETGTGKEEVARALFRHGPRAGKPWVAVNCAAIPFDLLESELFGHVRGAFTGAVNARAGKFREADGGTLFLDEIGDMTLPMQAKILRALQDRAVTAVGASHPVPVDVRIVSATHRDLIAMVKAGAFREDLFYRLNVVRIPLPPLRERGSDILVLAEHFLRTLAGADGRPKRLSHAAAQALLKYPWPGNVRELRNLLHHAVVTGRGAVIDRDQLEFAASAENSESLEDLSLLPYAEAIRRLEISLVRRALREADGNRAEAARRLGIHRQFLYAKMKELKIADPHETGGGPDEDE